MTSPSNSIPNTTTIKPFGNELDVVQGDVIGLNVENYQEEVVATSTDVPNTCTTSVSNDESVTTSTCSKDVKDVTKLDESKSDCLVNKSETLIETNCSVPTEFTLHGQEEELQQDSSDSFGISHHKLPSETNESSRNLFDTSPDENEGRKSDTEFESKDVNSEQEQISVGSEASPSTLPASMHPPQGHFRNRNSNSSRLTHIASIPPSPSRNPTQMHPPSGPYSNYAWGVGHSAPYYGGYPQQPPPPPYSSNYPAGPSTTPPSYWSSPTEDPVTLSHHQEWWNKYYQHYYHLTYYSAAPGTSPPPPPNPWTLTMLPRLISMHCPPSAGSGPPPPSYLHQRTPKKRRLENGADYQPTQPRATTGFYRD
jgi:hypothetical protein